MKPTREYLLDMLRYISLLEQFTAPGRAVLAEDVKTELAVRKAYEILGQIVKRLPDELLAQQPHIRWRELKASAMC